MNRQAPFEQYVMFQKREGQQFRTENTKKNYHKNAILKNVTYNSKATTESSKLQVQKSGTNKEGDCQKINNLSINHINSLIAVNFPST